MFKFNLIVRGTVSVCRSIRLNKFLSIMILSILTFSTILSIIPLGHSWISGSDTYVSNTDDLWWSGATLNNVYGSYIVPSKTGPWNFAALAWEHPSWWNYLEKNDFAENGADWIWKCYKVNPQESKTGDIVFFKKKIVIPEYAAGYVQASLNITADNAYYFYINNPSWTGTPVGSDGFAPGYNATNFYFSDGGKLYPLEAAIAIGTTAWSSIEKYDISALLQPGENWLQIVAINQRPPPKAPHTSVNTAGLIYKLEVFYEGPLVIPPDVGFAIPLSNYPTVDINVSLTPFVPYPVQVVFNPDINDDGRIDLVLGKPTAILVNVSGITSSINLTVTFESVSYTQSKTAAEISANSVLAFYPIIPQITGNKDITGIYTVAAGTFGLTSVGVTVKETSDLNVYYSYLYRQDKKGNPADYAYVGLNDFNNMVGNSTAFLNATCPVAKIQFNGNYTGIAGANKGTKDPLQGMLTDAMAVAQAAKTLNTNAIGVAIGPNATGYSDYFTYHGFPEAAAICFGSAVRGMVVQEGYWTAVAHEYGHIKGLYWGVLEQYQQYPPYGLESSGISVTAQEWRSGICFMGAAPYRTLNLSWVSDYTYEELFKQTRVLSGDPLVVSGIIYQNGTVEFPFDWIKVEDGIPDTIKPGPYSIVFLDENNEPLHETSFDAQFFVNIEPRIGTTGDISEFGKVQTDFAAFHFASYCPPSASIVQVVNKTDPNNPVVLAEVNISFNTWVTDSNFNKISSMDTVFHYDGISGYTLHNTNPGTIMFNVLADYNGPINVTIDLPSAKDSSGNIVTPAFNFQGNNPIKVYSDLNRNNDVSSNANITTADGKIILNLDIPDGEIAYVTIHLDYALKGNTGWLFETSTTDYNQSLPFQTSFEREDPPTIILLTTFKAIGR